jgi:hypothetical protein
MKASSYVPSFYFYKLAQGISAPYTSLEAYSAGTIDANGNIIKPESSIDSFEYLVIKLKKIFEELPYGTTKAKLSNYMATLNMFGEQFDLPSEEYNFFMEGFVAANVNEELSYIQLLEDMTTGGGAGPGPGGLSVPASPEVSQGGLAGYDPILGMGLKRRKKPKYFDNCEVFEVCPEEYISFKSAKQWKDVPDSETKNYLQRFQRRNKKAKIGIKSINPISGDHDLYWINYPGKDFINEEKGDPHFNAAASAVLEPLDDEKILRIKSGKINKTDAEQYGRAATFFSSLGNLTKKITEPFLNKTIETSKKHVSDTSEDGVGVDERGQTFVANFKNHRATFGTRGVEEIGFPEKVVTSFYDLKKQKSESDSEKEANKIESEMRRLRGQAREWSEPPSRQRAIAGLIKKHLDRLRQSTVAVTPHEEPILVPHEGMVKHVMKQPVRVVLGTVGERGRPEPQAQLAGSELARSRSGMETLKRNIEIQPSHVVPDQDDLDVAKDVLDPSLFAKFVKVFGQR